MTVRHPHGNAVLVYDCEECNCVHLEIHKRGKVLAEVGFSPILAEEVANHLRTEAGKMRMRGEEGGRA